MFTASPKYATLSRQVAQALAEQISRGAFGATLPSERWLADSMQISRRTLRTALQILRRDKIVGTIYGQGTNVLRVPPLESLPQRQRSIGLLLPDAVDQLEPYSTIFFDFLRSLLYENGYRLETHVGHSYYSQRPGASLAKLTERFSCEAWILAFSNRACQSWFSARQLPAVIVGTAHEGTPLPCVDVEMRATARHAASFLLAKGHRRIALIINEKNRAGDRLTEIGFLEGATKSGVDTLVPEIFRHGGTMSNLRRMVDRICRLATRPTALFIANPYHYMAVAGLISERGLKVPQDISLVCRDDDYCLRFLPVSPTRYVCSPEKRARTIFTALMSALKGDAADWANNRTLLFPELVEGDSVRRLPPS